jgi:hypothetical protein
VLNFASILYRLLTHCRAVDESEMPRFTFPAIVVLGLAGCAPGSFNAGGAYNDPQFRMEEPACYRETKSNYEAAGTGPDPNAALLNIGAALIAKDNALGLCTSARGREQIR